MRLLNFRRTFFCNAVLNFGREFVKMVTNHPFKIGVHWTRFYSENIDANVIMAQNGQFVHWEWAPPRGQNTSLLYYCSFPFSKFFFFGN